MRLNKISLFWHVRPVIDSDPFSTELVFARRGLFFGVSG